MWKIVIDPRKRIMTHQRRILIRSVEDSEEDYEQSPLAGRERQAKYVV